MLAAGQGRLSLEDIQQCTQGRLKASPEDLLRSLEGFFREHHRWQLKVLLDLITHMEEHLAAVTLHLRELMGDYGSTLARLCTIPGISDLAAMTILAEVGPSLDHFPSSAALASWAGLCPGNHMSAGKRQHGSPTVRGHTLKTLLVQSSWAAVQQKGSYYREKFYRLKARRGPKRAIVAIAHRLLKAVYHVITRGVVFHDLGAEYVLKFHQASRLKALQKQALVFGYELTPLAS